MPKEVGVLSIIDRAIKELELARAAIQATLPVVDKRRQPVALIDPTTGKPFQKKSALNSKRIKRSVRVAKSCV